VLQARHQVVGDLRQLQAEPLELEPDETAELFFVDNNPSMDNIAAFGVVQGSATAANRCTAQGAGLGTVVVGTAASFEVKCFDFHGEPRTSGGDRVEMVVEGPHADSVVRDNGNGTYSCRFTPTTHVAALPVHVRVLGGAIRGSPFQVTVRPRIHLPNVVFDPMRKGSTLWLSNGNRTATGAGRHLCALGTELLTEGKWYWEVRLDAGHASGGCVRLGIARPDYNVETHLGGANGAYGLYDTNPCGTVDGISQNYVPPLAQPFRVGLVVGWFLDLDANELSIFHDKVLQGKTAIARGPYKVAVSTIYTNDVVTVVHGATLPPALAHLI
jgi:hypothetical protein